MFVFHQKPDGATVNVTAEAVVKLFVLANRKRRRFFLVKRAIGFVVLTGLFKRYARVNHVHNVDTRQQIVDELLRDFARHGAILARPESGVRRQVMA